MGKSEDDLKIIRDALEEAGYKSPSIEHQKMIKTIIDTVDRPSAVRYGDIADTCFMSEKTAKRKIRIISTCCESLPASKNFISKFRGVIADIIGKEEKNDRFIVERNRQRVREN